MPHSLETLLPELRTMICEILASAHFPSLQALSLASKGCCAMTNGHRFQNIHFYVYAEDRFLVDIQHWERVLENIDGFQRDRRLSVYGQAPVAKHNNPDYCIDTRSPTFFQKGFVVEDEWTDFSRRCVHLHSLENAWLEDGVVADFNIITSAEFDAWRPLSNFLQKLQGLKDLFWQNGSQFPPSLLHVLHQDLASCRLHIRGFKLDSLGFWLKPEGSYAIDSYLLALATSPSLTSITCTYRGDGEGYRLNKAAMMQMAAGAAPNLLDIYLNKYSVRELFAGCPKTASSLRSLSLDDPAFGEIKEWDEHVAFSNLEVFQIMVDSFPAALYEIAGYSFAKLQSLILRLNSSNSLWEPNVRFDTVARLDHDASRLLSRLPPLKRFLLACYYTKECVDTALKCHGKTLEKLGVVFRNHNEPFRVEITPELIDKIRVSCPVLRDLTLRIRRSQGDAAEVSIYRAMGKIPNLRCLAIQLDCSRLWPLKQLNLFGALGDFPAEHPVIRETLINAAVEESLIRSILAIVAPPSSSLRSLRVEAVLGLMPSALKMIAELMQSVWEADLSIGGVSVRKTDSWKKRRELSSGTKYAEYKWLEEGSRCSKPFRSLWPTKGERWVDDWHSFPLQLD
ncbi:hypothetical protein BJY00DRAFT_299481 [Aspergillus carlsbadensis]|nr:hypothetical protein BJY00DRAFT_299481 [Aspergillus carlsbadensis]